ncbi:ATP-grasp domain-containing protein [Kitasatospora sp. NBC_01287]|uniref:acetyl/propionyl/methylcrotonyl-CoA carboxylase subunit alpha n=1 Tax=Kitasatospora sp. NBC_01287 TaxID=2903573 RepID=UPI00224E74A4|nr:biotin carboxylase N-terminal domain-containing protein [Kitasatospora sp. NBC_01287]MCX4748951.1 ATP-grasp domain-containing protein [Kitasatospora sp. NBC_01287]
MFDTVLVANRGEIAVRVIRTLRRLSIRSVAVYSDADADARHVREADTAVRLGPTDRSDSSATETYLRGDQIIAAALRTGAQAVHPGYGFLAENPGFARACAEAGLVFIGPPAEAVELMGDKINAKEAVSAVGVPVVPGSRAGATSDAELIRAAEEIGYPVLIKPSAGGGGKGMRLVRDPAELPAELAGARRVARTAFGDDTLLLERWVDRPRHIEVQVLADAHGTTVHLGERECSLQRRHQKLIEEAPSVLLDERTRAAMGAAAVRAAEACGYTGAGTVEFIVPGDDPDQVSAHGAHGADAGARDDTGTVREFFFMEMNTRLQVEHPVTELAVAITRSPQGGPSVGWAPAAERLDLVEWQLRVAAGESLSFAQTDVSFLGHAVEARICAEDPARDFLPTGGRILSLEEPSGEGIRVDSGLTAGTEITSAYDPMLGKVIAYGPDRATALLRLRNALADTKLLGVTTNAGFLRRLLALPDVVAGRLDTGLVERAVQQHPELLADQGHHGDAAQRSGPGQPEQSLGSTSDPASDAAASGTRPAPVPTAPDAVLIAAALVRHQRLVPTAASNGWTDPFALPSGWRLAGEPAWTTHRLRVTGQDPVTVLVRPVSADKVIEATDSPSTAFPEMLVRLGEGPIRRARAAVGATDLALVLDGLRATFAHATDNSPSLPGGPVLWLGAGGDSWALHPYDPVTERATAGDTHHGALTAPMPGTVTVVKAAVGDLVRRGQPLLVLEAMKMEHVIAAPHDGVVSELHAGAGSTVAMEQLLAVVLPAEPADATETAEVSS